MKEKFKPIEFIWVCNGCFNSLGNCRCKTIKLRSEEDIKQLILEIDRYEPTFDGSMDENMIDGEYLKLEDVLKIFS